MRTFLPVACLVAGACTPDAPAVLPDLRDLTAQAEEHSRDATWAEETLAEGVQGAWQLRSGALRTYVATDRIAVVDRRQSTPTWQLELTARAWGRAGHTAPLPPGTPWADGPRVDLQRGAVTEWFVNLEEGLEHGFTLHEAPPGAGPVVVELGVDGLTARALPDGARFSDAAGPVVDWRGLVVRDASGRSLRAWTEVTEDTVVVAFDDAGARWPVEVDPLLTSLEGEFDLSGWAPLPARTGFSLAADGDVMILGNPGVLTEDQDGIALIVARNANGVEQWGVRQSISADTADVHVGQAVAMSLPYVAVSSPQSGKVQILSDLDGTWVRETLIDRSTDGGFGSALAMDGEVLAAGFPDDTDGGAQAGSLSIYHRHEGGTGNWGEVEQLHASSPAGGERLGEAVDVAGTLVVGGAPNPAGVGSVILWRYDASSGLHTEETELTLGSGGTGDRFGAAVDADLDFVVVGAPGAERASVFEHTDGTLWVETELPAPPEAGEAFGTRVAISGDTAAVADLPTSGTAGIHLFERSASGWTYVESLDGGASTGEAAQPIVLEPSLLAVGMPETASFRVWRRTAGRWLQDAQTSPVSPASEYGKALDIEGPWLAVGVPDDDTSSPGYGATHLFRNDGSAWIWDVALPCPLGGGAYDGACGTSVDLAGDLLVQGAPTRDELGVSHGAAFLYDLSDVVLPVLVATVLPDSIVPNPERDGLRFGDAVALSPPFLAVGEPGRGTGNQGGVQVFSRDEGGAGVWGFVAEPTLGTVTGDRLGATLAAAGDVLLVGGPLADRGGHVDNGVVEVWRLDTATPTMITFINGPNDDHEFGRGLAVRSDVLAIGAPGTFSDAGRVFLYALEHNGTELYSAPNSIDPQVVTAGGRFGEALALSGERLVVGSPGADLAEVHLRNQGGADAWGHIETFAGTPGDAMGTAVAAGPDTIVVGEPGPGGTDGAIHIFELDADLPPLARADTYVLAEDTNLFEGAPGVLDNDHEPNGDPLQAELLSGPAHAASFDLAADGSFGYTPELDWDQPDTFTYRVTDGVLDSGPVTVTLGITPVNDAPVAQPDLAWETDEEVLLAVASPGVLGNDSDVDDTVLIAVLDQPPANGSLTLGADGSFQYTPEVDFYGADTFRYHTEDDEGAASETVDATITVHPINDPPNVPVPPELYVDVLEDAQLVAVPPGLLDPTEVSDPDGDVLQTRLSSNLTTQGAVLVYANGAWTYTPPPEFAGRDVFQIEVGDGSVWVTVTVFVDVVGVNDAPVGNPDAAATPEDRPLQVDPTALVVNDTDVEPGPLAAVLEPALPPEHGSIVVDPISGRFVYTPDLDYVGTDVFYYRARDLGGAESEPVPVTVTITSLNDAPVALDDELPEALGTTPVVGELLANDSDPDGDAITAELTSPPVGGDVTVSPDGWATYVARPGFVGPDRFLYVAVDATGTRSIPASVDVVVLPDPNAGTTPPTVEDTGCETSTWYLDADGDGLGNADRAVEACGAPDQHVSEVGDCDDSRADVFPGAREVSGDDIDQDCDGLDNQIRPVGCATGPGAPAGALLLTMLLVLARPARGSALCADDTAGEVDVAVSALWDAWSRVDEEDFDRTSKNLEGAIACLDVVPTGAQVARLHQGMALVSFVNGQTKASRRSLTAARLADPGWKLPEDRFPASHPFRDLWASATDPGPVAPLGSIAPERWVVDGQDRDDSPIERAFLLQVTSGDDIRWSGYLWTRDEVPDRGQDTERSPTQTPRDWQVSFGLHGRALSSRQRIERGTPSAEAADGLGLGGGIELGVRATPTSVVGGEVMASLTSGADPVLGGGGSPSAHAVVLLGGGGWMGELQPWGAARLGAGVDRLRAWTFAPSDLQPEVVTVASAVVGLEGGVRSEDLAARLAADVLLQGAQRPWLFHGRIDTAAAITDPVAVQASLDLRAGGLPLEDVDGAAAGQRSDTDFRVGAAVLLWL